MTVKLALAAVGAVGLVTLYPSQADAVPTGLRAFDCGGDQTETASIVAQADPNGYTVEGSQTTSGSTDCGGGDDDPWDYRYREKMCGTGVNINFCAAVYCPDPQETGYFEQRRPEGSQDQWRSNGFVCVGPDGPTVTPERVLEALRQMGLPKAELQTEPGFDSGKTLVNFDTNFYTTVQPVTETFTLLGAQVTVEATPASYIWHFDSGRSDQIRTTTTAGSPYPDLDVTYAYEDAHITVHPSVDVVYSAQFSVNGGTWQTIPDTVTITGDPISRYVAEAEARLSGMN